MGKHKNTITKSKLIYKTGKYHIIDILSNIENRIKHKNRVRGKDFKARKLKI